jgi:hypothetical protein
VEDGVTRAGQSDFFTIRQNTTTGFNANVSLAAVDPVPTSLILTASTTTLTTAGATTQLTVTATLPDGNTRDVTARSSGASYTTSNRAVATVSADGLVTAVASGGVIVSALNEGALGLIRIQVTLTDGDTDGDGIPDDVELANGLNPNDPTDASQDADGDGLTNKQELIDLGTNLRAADTDGDGVRDGLEVQTGSDPLDPRNFNLAQALTAIEVAPPSFTLIVNTIMGEASNQLSVTGRLQDGTTIDLTSTAMGTSYTTSDPTICTLGAPAGRVFAGSDGSCVVTVTNSGFSTPSSGAVTTFSPIALSSIPISGYANNVDVNGNFAYVAAGAAGLQVVDVSDPRNPQIVGAMDTTGNANDVRIVGNLVYIADGSAGLQIIDISTPTAPVIVGAVDTPGEAQDVAVSGVRAYVADGDFGLQIVDMSNPAAPHILGTVDTPGIARGVAVSGNLALVADDAPPGGVAAVRVIGVTNAQIVGSLDLPEGEAKDLAVRGALVYVAAFNGGFQVVDISVPSRPRLIGGIPSGSGFLPRDVELSNQFALTPDDFFAGAVAITDISASTSPLFRARLDLSSGGQFYGTGIATDSRFVYMAGDVDIFSADNGSTGNSGLLIGQYLAFPDDTAGVPPMVKITSPAAGETVVEGAPLPITVDASDDVAIVAVEFLVNGQMVVTGTREGSFIVPSGVTSLTLSARAIDPGGNVGTAADVVVNVIPDTEPPTVSITSPISGETAPAGTTLPIVVDVTDNAGVASVDFLVNGEVVFTGTTSPYQFDFPVPVESTTLTLNARAVDLSGNVGVATDVVVSIIPDPPPTVRVTFPALGDTVIERVRLPIAVEATDDIVVESVNFLVNGQVVFTTTTTPYQFNFKAPVGVSSVTLGATAVDSLGQVGAAADVVVNVIPDPGTTATGQILNASGSPVVGARVTCLGVTGVTDADGRFSLTGVPTIQGDVHCGAVLVTASGQVLTGVAQAPPPVRGGTTTLTAFTIREGPLYSEPKAPAGERVSMAAMADLNRDSILDVVAANSDSNDVSVTFGSGNGLFVPQQRFAVGTNPQAVSVADLNGDTFLDIVTANISSRDVSVLLGDGAGSFAVQRRFPTNSTTGNIGPNSVTVGDLNSDGVPDIVTANGNEVSVLVGAEGGNFTPQQRFAAGSGARAVTLADLTQDNNLDVIVVNFSTDRASVLRGLGTGALAAAVSVAVGDGPVSVVVTDVNRDGVLDLVTANQNSRDLSVRQGTGGGAFAPEQRVNVGDIPRWVTAGDLTGDGIVDLVASITQGSVFQAVHKLITLAGRGDGAFGSVQETEVGAELLFVAVADVNADSVLDVAGVPELASAVSLFLGKGDGAFETVERLRNGFFPSDVVIADLDDDDVPDLVVGDASSMLIYLGTGGGHFTAPQAYSAGGAEDTTAVAVGDLNNDDIPDIVKTNVTGAVSILLGDGYGALQDAQDFVVTGGPRDVAITDVNRDGALDLLTANTAAGDVSLLLGNGDGTFRPEQKVTAFPGAQELAVADFTGDTFVDLAVVGNFSNQVGILRGNGDGAFQPLQPLPAGPGAGAVTAADLNQDGKADLIVSNRTAEDVAVMRGNGDGTFQSAQRFVVGSDPGSIQVADLNRDGHLDLAVTNFGSREVSVLLGKSDGTFAPEQRYGTEGSPVAAGDLDGDGLPDLVTPVVTVLRHR